MNLFGIPYMPSTANTKHADRKVTLLRELQAHEPVALSELAQRVGVSESTLRRDLREIIDTGYARMSAGRVELVTATGEEVPFPLRERVNDAEKKRIAQTALNLIQNGETVFISGGTTTLELARLLPGRRRLTAITNSLRVVNVLVDRPGIELVVLGGKVRPDEQTMHGHLTELAAQELRADKFFYGIPAIHPLHGLTHGQTNEISTDRAMAAAVTHIIVLADHTKFGRVAPALVMPLSKVNTVITGCEIAHEFLESLRSQNVKVLLA
jgi:DeoR/GlpR family transcriptional regulator of sugar metabolism